MSEIPPCPKCGSAYVYPDGALLICPECAHEWSPEADAAAEAENQVRDSVGNVLQDGDDVIVTQTMKVKGAPSTAQGRARR